MENNAATATADCFAFGADDLIAASGDLYGNKGCSFGASNRERIVPGQVCGTNPCYPAGGFCRKTGETVPSTATLKLLPNCLTYPSYPPGVSPGHCLPVLRHASGRSSPAKSRMEPSAKPMASVPWRWEIRLHKSGGTQRAFGSGACPMEKGARLS